MQLKKKMSYSKKHVCVIGGGSSGLILMKELKESGHTFECFEKLPVLGGVYVKAYQSTILTTSSLLTAWSDYSDGKEDQPKFWTAEEYLDYLEGFARKYNLYEHINFRHSVELIQKCPETGKWLVTVKGGQGCKDIERCENFAEDPLSQPRLLSFDCIAICSGTNNFPYIPIFPGQETFSGTIIHSEQYRCPEVYAGKRVLIVGSGESGSDITNEVSKYASKVGIVIRGKHGHLIPRIQAHGRVTDLNTNRCRYSNPYIFGDWIGYSTQMAKRFFLLFAKETDNVKVLKKISEFNMFQKTSAFSKSGCKNEGFVTAIVLRGAELFREDFELKENKAVFKSGAEFECDAIIACTGFRNAFPFLEKYHPEIVTAGMNPRSNYKQVFCIAYPGEVGFIGFARPAFGSIPPTAEMQARFYTMVLNEEVKLPNQEDMTMVALKDQKNWESRFGYDVKRVKGLVDFQIYCDSLAELMGVMPPLWNLFFTKFWLWYKIIFGPFTTHMYRLVGPRANPARAEEVYAKQPVGDFLENTITASFLMTAKLLYLLGFKQFKPNNF